MDNKAPVVKILDDSEKFITKPPPPKYEPGQKKIPPKYTLDEASTRASLGEKSQIAGDVYKEYKEFQGYFSNQFDSCLQKNIRNQCKESYVGVDDQEDILNVNLKPLDIEMDILDDFTVVLIGRRRSGKSFLARWLMYHLRNRFPAGVVITGTKLNDFWCVLVPKEFIHDVENISTVLENVYKRQEFLISHPELGIDHRLFIILDDGMVLH